MDTGALLNMMMQAEATAARAAEDTPLAPVRPATTPMDRAWAGLAARMNAAAAQMDGRVRRTAQCWQNRIFDGAGIEPHDTGTGD
jgi:hypothetical protein